MVEEGTGQPTGTARDDLVQLSDYVWQRLRRRMDGLSDHEYLWEPVPGCRTIRRMDDGTYRSDGPAGADDPRQFTTMAWLSSRSDGSPATMAAPPAGPSRYMCSTS